MNQVSKTAVTSSRTPVNTGVLSLLSWVVLGLCVIATLALWKVALEDLDRDVGVQFDRDTAESGVLIGNRIKTYATLLRSGVALFDSTEHVDRKTWHNFAKTLDASRIFPGIQGIGWAEYVDRGQVQAHIERVRGEGFPDYKIIPEGNRDSYVPVVYLEPFVGRNLRAFGYDMNSEAVRREAMARARDSGEAVASGKVILVQEYQHNSSPGFLLYLPVYDRNKSLATVEERRRALKGFVYAPFRMVDLMSEVLGDWESNVVVRIYDGTEPRPEALMYESSSGSSETAEAHARRTIQFLDHSWLLDVSRTTAYAADLDRSRPQLILVSGLAVSFLLFGIFQILLWSRAGAIRLARRMTASLRASEAYSRAVIDNMVDGIVTMDAAGRIIDASPVAERIFGWTRDELVGGDVSMIIPNVRWLQSGRDTSTASQADNLNIVGVSQEAEGRRRDGGLFPIELSVASIPSEAGERLIGLVRDISQRRANDAQINLAARVFEGSNEAIMITDASHKIAAVNRAFSELTGYTAEEAIGVTPTEILSSGRLAPEFWENVWSMVEQKGGWAGEVVNRKKDGELIHEWLSISVVRDKAGAATNYIEIFTDITERKLAEDRIHTLAHYDHLTKLPNRILLRDRLKQQMLRSDRTGLQTALVFIDLDLFKNVNDTLGHAVGDKLLVAVSRTLINLVRASDTVSRQGGDEFVLVLSDISSTEDVAAVAEKAIDAMAQRFEIDGHVIQIGCSIGIAMYPTDSRDIDQLMQFADIAMYQSKAGGRSMATFFSAEMNVKINERAAVESAIRSGLERDEFFVVYQPQYHIRTGKLCGFEALLRWQHPTEGVLPPGTLIPVAETSGQIIDIGRKVVRQVCRDVAAWTAAGCQVPRIGINFSSVQIASPDFFEDLTEIFAEEKVNPVWMDMEITESVLLRSEDQLDELFDSIRRLGITISIDDFGTGYSSFLYLKRFRVNRIKIDQGFVRDMAENSGNAALCDAIISVAKSLGLKVVAEGVETEEQLLFLGELGCDEAQGFYFSEAVRKEVVASMLSAAGTDLT